MTAPLTLAVIFFGVPLGSQSHQYNALSTVAFLTNEQNERDCRGAVAREMNATAERRKFHHRTRIETGTDFIDRWCDYQNHFTIFLTPAT